MFGRKKEAIAEPSDLDREVSAAYVALGIRQPDQTTEPGLAKETLISLLQRFADRLASTGDPKQAGQIFAFADTLSGGALIETLAQMDTDAAKSHARMLMASGRLLMAQQAYDYVTQNDPDDHGAHRNLSAILHTLGQADTAQDLMQKFYQRNPSEARPLEAGQPARKLHVVRGFDKTRYKLSPHKDGYRRFRSGGHFMLKHLVNQDAYNIQRYTVANGNIFDTPPEFDPPFILNTIADADTEHQSLTSLEAFLAAQPHIDVINHPTRVLATIRDNNYNRLNVQDGFRFPKTMRFSTIDKPAGATAKEIEDEGFSYPMIIRETGTHTASTTELIDSPAALAAYLERVKRDSVYVIEFIENASPEGHYSKIRFFCIDGQLYPVVYHVDQVWNVHGSNRKTFMAAHDWMVERERAFLQDPSSIIGESIYARLKTLPALIGLDFFGFDCTLMDDGTILIFELNPAMRHSFDHAENFPYMRPHLQAISDAFETMVDTRLERAIKQT